MTPAVKAPAPVRKDPRRLSLAAPLRSVAALGAVVALAIVISPRAADGSCIFLEPGNLTDILRQISIIGIISLAMTCVILTGGIDLSVGSILALSTSLVAMFLTRMWQDAGYSSSPICAFSPLS